MSGFILLGDKQLIRALNKLPNAIYNRVIAKVNAKVMKPVVARARALAPIDSGLLKKSLGAITRKYPRNSAVLTILGARSGFSATSGRTTKDGKEQVHVPAKIAHLVELGHGGPHAAPAHPFLRPAFDGQKASMLQRYKLELQVAIEREARRTAKS